MKGSVVFRYIDAPVPKEKIQPPKRPLSPSVLDCVQYEKNPAHHKNLSRSVKYCQEHAALVARVLDSLRRRGAGTAFDLADRLDVTLSDAHKASEYLRLSGLVRCKTLVDGVLYIAVRDAVEPYSAPVDVEPQEYRWRKKVGYSKDVIDVVLNCLSHLREAHARKIYEALGGARCYESVSCVLRNAEKAGILVSRRVQYWKGSVYITTKAYSFKDRN